MRSKFGIFVLVVSISILGSVICLPATCSFRYLFYFFTSHFFHPFFLSFLFLFLFRFLLFLSFIFLFFLFPFSEFSFLLLLLFSFSFFFLFFFFFFFFLFFLFFFSFYFIFFLWTFFLFFFLFINFPTVFFTWKNVGRKDLNWMKMTRLILIKLALNNLNHKLFFTLISWTKNVRRENFYPYFCKHYIFRKHFIK